MFRPHHVSLSAASLVLLAPSLAFADPGCPHMFANKACILLSLIGAGFLAVPIGVVGLLSMAGLRAFNVIGNVRRFPLALVGNLPLAFFTVVAFMAIADAAHMYAPANDRWSGTVTLGVPLLVQVAYIVLVTRAFRRQNV